MDDQTVERIVAEHRGSLGGMLSILSEVQAKYGYLSQDALRRIAAATGDSLTDIYAVATFYKAFSLKPRGKHLVSVCLGTACHVRGGELILDSVERELNVKTGQVTGDYKFGLERVACVGCCALAPVVVIDQQDVFGKMTQGRVKEMLAQYKKGTGRKAK